MSEPRPVEQGERVALIDVLRGFALLGILVVNFFGEQGSVLPLLDRVATVLLGAFVDSSFYPLFSFLFGLGFALQLARARRRGDGAAHLYLRRMIVLFLIGTVHAVFIWSGDILVTYAVTGLLLIPLHRLPQRVILALVCVLCVVNLHSKWVREQVTDARRADATEVELRAAGAIAEELRIAQNERLLAATPDATYWQVTTDRWKLYAENVRRFGDWLDHVLRDVLIFFLIGLVVGRAGVLERPHDHARGLAVAAGLGFVALIGGNAAVQVIPLDGGFLSRVVLTAGNIGGTAFYIAGIALLFTHMPAARRWLGVFAVPGRMGLSNYLMQSMTMTALSMPYGLGWRPTTTIWLLLNVTFFFLVQVPLSRWWLARFRYGPAEWLWRSLTYGKRQPMRLPAPATVDSRPLVKHGGID